jgi:Trp operon repressor
MKPNWKVCSQIGVSLINSKENVYMVMFKLKKEPKQMYQFMVTVNLNRDENQALLTRTSIVKEQEVLKAMSSKNPQMALQNMKPTEFDTSTKANILKETTIRLSEFMEKGA